MERLRRNCNRLPIALRQYPYSLEAVKEFRRKLDRTHCSQKTQRIEMVAKKLKELRPKIRAQVDAEMNNRRQGQKKAQSASLLCTVVRTFGGRILILLYFDAHTSVVYFTIDY